MKARPVVFELDDMDGIIWCRPISADRDTPWRPVSGERGMNAKTISEAKRVLRAEGRRVTSRRSGQ